MSSAGQRFRDALAQNDILQITGTANAYCAILARDAGINAIYISGGALAAVSYGLPDLGMTTLEDVLIDTFRIASAVETPLLVDIDTGWDDMQQTVTLIIQAGAAAAHLEDQVPAKRCGHRPNKQLVSCADMVKRIQDADTARQQSDPNFYLIARTDAFAVEGKEAAIERAIAYQQAGADAIFAEACHTLEDYKSFVDALDIPVLANITEFGQTPLFTAEELASVGVKMMLYPFTATRMMNKAALNTYETIQNNGTQSSLIDQMQTREELYEHLNYHSYEQVADEALHKKS